MKNPLHTLPAGARALALAVLLAACPGRAEAGINVAIQPAIMNVGPGWTFDLLVNVTNAESYFNAFQITLAYDSTALEFVPLVPISAQQGCLMIGTCSLACGNTFHRFEMSSDSLWISNSLLCNQISLLGPGTVYKLRFRARDVRQATWIRFARATFLNAGLYVTPVTTADCYVGIGVTVGVDESPRPPGLRVRAEPNPSRGRLAFAIESDRAGASRVEVLDLAGRLVASLAGGWREAGSTRLAWDGTDAAGARVRPGVYLVRARVGEASARARIAIVE